MKVVIGKEGLNWSFQDLFVEDVECVHCGAIARIGFVAHEMDEKVISEGGEYVLQLHCDDKENMWLRQPPTAKAGGLE